MSEIENEKAILEETPDFDSQRKILDEEKEMRENLRKFYTRIGSIFFFMFLIILIAYYTIDIYIEYTSFISSEACDNVNIDVKDEDYVMINIAKEGSCVPEYNIDYYNNRRAMFNLDLFGDGSYIFNKMNQMDQTGSYCTLNCDNDGDGWPDYNIDLNGDGKADINIVKDPAHNTKCDLNCDINFDTIPDTNIDVDGDGNADVNITDDDINKPKYNIDYKGNRKPVFNIRGEDGSISNEVTDVSRGGQCTKNCDVDGDGWPDYNITLPDSSIILNELITGGSSNVEGNKDKKLDWKCFIAKGLKECLETNTVLNNKYINIDVDGDGRPDVNLSSDHGVTITNEINKPVVIDDKNVILNEDKNGDGFPDYNIDVDGDGLPDLNITGGNDYICTKNCDTNNDGKSDYLIDVNGQGKNPISIKNINIDIDYDGICDVNCDNNFDLYPDINVDTNGDKMPDINIDYDGDGILDFNIDTDGDGKPDQNLSAFSDGVCNFNCTDKINEVTHLAVCEKNCDTNNDGWPDVNVDLDGDGTCDINCDNGTTNIDKNGDYFIDSEDHTKSMIIDKSDKESFYVLNPIDIVAKDIEPGWQDTYVLNVINNTPYAIAYKLYWADVTNEFTDENNLDYSIFRNGSRYLPDQKAPRLDMTLKDEVLIRGNTTLKYVMKVSWAETGFNQNIDSGKIYKGKLKIETIK